MSGTRHCGRSTKSGRPCANTIWGAEVSCGVHKHPEDQALIDAYNRGRDEERALGLYERGFEAGLADAGRRAAREAAEEAERANFRTSVGGDQIVTVGRYSYRWGGEPLRVGDTVELPGNWLTQARGVDQPTGVVTGIGSSYTGPLASVVRVLDGKVA